MIANFRKAGRYSTLAFLAFIDLIFAFSQTGAITLHSGFPISSTDLFNASNIEYSVVNYDYDRDGQTEVIFGTNEGGGYLIFVNSTGAVENYFGPAGGPCTAPSIADIDADGELEIVFGSQAYADSAHTILKAAIYAIRADMSLVSGFPAVILGLDENGGINHAPSLYDVDGDGKQEIFSGTVG